MAQIQVLLHIEKLKNFRGVGFGPMTMVGLAKPHTCIPGQAHMLEVV